MPASPLLPVSGKVEGLTQPEEGEVGKEASGDGSGGEVHGIPSGGLGWGLEAPTLRT